MVALIPSIAYHVAIGAALAVAVWLWGLGLLLPLGDRIRDAAVHAYPVGLLAALAASFLFLLQPWLGLFGAFSAIGAAFALSRNRRKLPGTARRLGTALLWAAPGVVAFPFALGLLLHGPSSNLDSNAFGDMIYYVARLQATTESVVPFRDLLVEGERIPYVGAGSSFIGALLSHLPGFDAFLFQTTALPAFLLTSISLGVGSIARSAQRQSAWLPALAVLAVSIVAYPTWIAESPPVALALPLAFSVFALWFEPVPPGVFGLLAAVVAVDLFVTKTLAVIPLGVLALIALGRHYQSRITRRQASVALATSAVLAAAALAFFFRTSGWLMESLGIKFLPADAFRGLGDQLTTRDTQAASPALQILGHVLVGLALFRSRSYALLATLLTSVAANWLIGGHTIDIATDVAVLLAALHFWVRPDLLRQQGLLIIAAGISLALSGWFRESYGVQAGCTLVILFGTTLLGAFLGASRAPVDSRLRRYAWTLTAAAMGVLLALSGRPFVGAAVVATLAALPVALRLVPARPRRLGLAFAVSLIAVGSAAATVRAAAHDDLHFSEQHAMLTPSDYDVWRRIRELVPSNGLVFTTLTGRERRSEEGWNYYPAVSERQLYIGGWLYSGLSSRAEARSRRLALNRSVVSGAIEPDDLSLDRRYGSYFAVLRLRERTPPSFQLVYSNARYAIYRIGTAERPRSGPPDELSHARADP